MIPGNDSAAIEMMRRRCDALLSAMLGLELAAGWWQRNNTNKTFGGRTPEDVFAENPQAVFDYLMGAAYGG
ncbi:hypothetical protein UFOVP116_155 [uncultured Caudovirales phage]|uniref:Uncharacterized protein n=1 Tax=uncultured Caudovirales phage TaxID=2100421 RepID=A0A6J5L663_9CAUD|nr:hypothetical protein UFOVP116_155 [uncultured Caudovirales phage]